MKSEDIIKVSNVHKRFKLYFDRGQSFKEKILFKNRNRYEDRWVLKGISFNVKKGEAVGLIGENGCGKSTMLKMMTKIMYPDNGDIIIKGRISSLIELGAGFHPDMSGRENIYTNASIFGLTRREIDERIEKIIEFSELEQFIDNPVRTYSSGMYMRLAFSVAINVDADVLLIDEILAVGDASFQAKCFKKIMEIKNEGVTIVIVSHDKSSIEKICDKVIWIEKGKIKDEGKPYEIFPEYMDSIMNKDHMTITEHGNDSQNIVLNNENSNPERDEELVYIETLSENDKIINTKNSDDIDLSTKRFGNKDLLIKKIKMFEIKNDKEEERYRFNSKSKIKISIDYIRNNQNIKNTIVGFRFFKIDGTDCYGTNTYIDDNSKIEIKEKGIISIYIDPIQLLSGDYYVDIAFHEEFGTTFDYILRAKFFEVINTKGEVGVVYLNHSYKHD